MVEADACDMLEVVLSVGGGLHICFMRYDIVFFVNLLEVAYFFGNFICENFFLENIVCFHVR